MHDLKVVSVTSVGVKGWSLKEVFLRDLLKAPNFQEKWGTVEIHFMPNLRKVRGSKKREDPTSTNCVDLSEHYGIPDFFWTIAAFEFNGFFGSQQNSLKNFSGKSYTTWSRFLIKEVHGREEDGYGYPYDWHYVSFFTLWCASTSDQLSPSQIVFCFIETDPSSKKEEPNSTELQDTIKNHIMLNSTPGNLIPHPFCIYEHLVSALVEKFDHALWKAQPLVRDIEKENRMTVVDVPVSKSGNEDKAQKPPPPVKRRIAYIHELSRHVIHMRETLDVATRTLSLMEKSHVEHHGVNSLDGIIKISKWLQFYGSLFLNLRDRADAFDERLRNEISCAFNLLTAEDSATAKVLLKETQNILQTQGNLLSSTRNDGRELTNLVSLLTLLFLPGTFFAGFFGMNLFAVEEGKLKSTQIYYFLGPTAMVTMFAFYVWTNLRGISLNPKRWKMDWLIPRNQKDSNQVNENDLP